MPLSWDQQSAQIAGAFVGAEQIAARIITAVDRTVRRCASPSAAA
jgi:hypothetical protein